MALFRRNNIVYYPGATLSKFFPELVQNWKTILSDFGYSVEVLDNFHSGWSLWDMGYQQEFEAHIGHLRERIKRENIKKIITSSPEAHYIFTTFLPEIESKHTTEVVMENLHKVQQFNNATACFHDNTTQVRRNMIVHQPREILVRAGFRLREFTENRSNTQCLGTSTGLINNSPRLAEKLALRRIKNAPADLIITDSPEDYVALKRATNVQVQELSEVLVEI